MHWVRAWQVIVTFPGALGSCMVSDCDIPGALGLCMVSDCDIPGHSHCLFAPIVTV